MDFSVNRVRDILDFIPDATLIVNSAGQILFANQQVTSVFGYLPEELAGQQVEALIPERFQSAHPGLRRAFTQSPHARPMGSGRELFGIRKDGTEIPVEISLGPVTDDDATHVCVAIRDISVRNDAERALSAARDAAERATEIKSRFLAAASHDLRQPLQTITIYTDVLRRTITDNPELALGVTNKIDTSLNVMGDLLDALLNIAKLDAGTVEPQIKHVSLQSVLDILQADTRPAAEKKELSLEVEPSGDYVESDPSLLRCILDKLVANAIRYTDTGGIRIRANRVNNRVEIEVADTGIGIPDDSLSSIFDEFFQLDNRARERRKGMGLGLSIVRLISSLLDTPVSVCSKIGVGSVFTVSVPAGIPHTSHVADTSAGLTGTNEGPPLIFIAEDDPQVRDATKMMMELAGFRTEVAGDGDAAISMLSGGIQPDMVVSDYRLPGANGIEVIQHAKKVSRANLPAIMITGDTTSTRVVETELTECTVMTKPVDTTELIEVIQQALSAET